MRHHDGAVPVNGDKRPGERARHGGQVDEARVRVVAEVEGREVGKVEDQQDLGPDKVRAHKEHDEAEVEEVVGDEVWLWDGVSCGPFWGGSQELSGMDVRLPTAQAALTDSALDEKRCEM